MAVMGIRARPVHAETTALLLQTISYRFVANGSAPDTATKESSTITPITLESRTIGCVYISKYSEELCVALGILV